MEKLCKIKEVEGLYSIVHLEVFRETKGVKFDIFPTEFITDIASMDRVIHESFAISPGSIMGVERPWYMHPHQSDNLVVLHGERHIDLYTKKHGKVENFVVSSDKIYQNGELVCDVPAVLIWPERVFHRVESKEQGSASINFAKRSKGFDIDTNFNIYDLNTTTGKFHLLRKGEEDQYNS